MNQSGLSSDEAKQRLLKYGPNVVPEKHQSAIKRLVKWLFSPITLMLLAAAGLSWVSHHNFDFWLIIGLTALNGFVTFRQEQKANRAVDELKSKLQVRVRTLRDGGWTMINSEDLVPGDVLELTVGNLVPADSKLVEVKNLSVNQAAITGESLPVEKAVGDSLLSGSFVTTGLARAIVVKTGAATTYGKAIILVEKATKRSLLEQDILGIAYLLAIASLAAVALLTIVFLTQHQPVTDLLRLDLSLLIAGIPVSLPTVMTIIISIGVVELSRRGVIVRQMSALENLANVNLLLSDKTGTLTQNSLSVSQVVTYGGATADEILALAAAISVVEQDPINQALRAAASSKATGLKVVANDVIPADSNRKRSSGVVEINGHIVAASVGAVQVILALCRKDKQVFNKVQADVEVATHNGYRVLAIAQSHNLQEKNMTLIGLLMLSDPLRTDAAETIQYLRHEGIETKMVTGDNSAIAQRVAKLLGLGGKVLSAKQLPKDGSNVDKSWWGGVAGFAEILPQDKYRLVEAAKHNFVVAATGDGVNDLPAVTSSDIGFAVNNAVDALKGSADIVLTTPGIAVIKDALVEARKIFERLYSYSVYRISESLRLIVTIAILGLSVHAYPVSPIQLILLAFLNDLPIISLAFNHVRAAHAPGSSRSKRKLYRGMLHGTVGIASSLTLFYIMRYVIGLPLAVIQTAFFLKLTVSGHMLIYVAHTDERWYHFLPSRPVIAATTITQLIATVIAGAGLFMARLPIMWIVIVWLWSFGWMQVSDMAKALIRKK